MPFDFKKEYKEFYMPSGKPSIVDVPSANYLAVRGKGNPNEEGGDYKKAIEMLYSVAYTLKMSPKNGRNINGFFDYVVPPLEGFWWQEGVEGVDLSRRVSSAGFRSSACPTLSLWPTLSGRCRLLPVRRKSTARRLSSSPSTRGCVCRFSTLGHTTTSSTAWSLWSSGPSRMAIEWTFPTADCTTRYTSPMLAKRQPKSCAPLFATR